MSDKIKQPRAIIDRGELVEAITALVTQELPKSKRRQQLLALLKDTLTKGFAEVRRRFEEHGKGPETVRENCFLVDQIVRVVHDFACEHEFQFGVKTTGEQLSIIAVGGYGRGELSPSSDIDLLFLLPYKKTPYSEQVVEFILYMLWDLGLKVGHSTRNIDECVRQAKADLTIRTALLEMRWLWGDQALFNELHRKYRSDIMAGTGAEFVEAKLAERNERHERMGDTRYVLEPNIKESKGGLRDLHTLTWIAKYLYDIEDIEELATRGILPEATVAKFLKARAFLWTVRCHLHYLTGRAEDRLTFDLQTDIGARMNYTDHAGSRGVERFMKHYFLIAKDVGDLTRIFCALLEEQNKRKPKLRLATSLFKRSNIDGFRVDGDRLNVLADDDFVKDPVKLIRLFHASLTHDLDVHPHAMSLVTQNLRRIDAKLRADPEANRLFVEMLCSRKDPQVALRHMNEAGVLGRFVPDFGRVVAQMQYDMYHCFTVDEHTLQAVGVLHRVEAGLESKDVPLSTEIIHKIQSRRALFLSVFLHDIAKGRGGDHSELGAEVAMKLGPRLGLTDEETETTSWLVRHHLLMTKTAFKRDVSDPKTIHDFVDIVQSPERLRLLTLLTVADVRAVGPTVWNGWKGGLLRELYWRSEELMSGGLEVEKREARVTAAQSALRQELADKAWTAEDIEAHMARGYPNYWVSFDTLTLMRHARMVREAETSNAPITIDSKVDGTHGVTEVTIYTGDHPGLFSQIAGAMALSGASIVDAKIITMTNGMALDTFWIMDPAEGSAFDKPDKLSKLTQNLEQALTGRLHLQRELAGRKSNLPARSRVFKVPPRVLIDNKASRTHTVIEINGRDRPGFLYTVCSAMTKVGLQISSAHISTYGPRVVDVFYVKDVFGLKVEHDSKLKQVRETLLEAITEAPAEKPAVTAAQ